MAGIGRWAAAVTLGLFATLAPAQEKPAAPPRGPDAKLFRDPPSDARPHVVYAWMDGNVTQGGIDADLTAMRDIGVGGLLMGDVRGEVPKGPVAYLGNEWFGLATGMMAKADQLGLKVGLQETDTIPPGGAWITPEFAAQRLVWTETTVEGGEPLFLPLPRPHAQLGYYRDAAVIAFPASDGDEHVYGAAIEAVTTDVPVAPEALLDHNSTTGAATSSQAPMVVVMKAPFPAQAVTVQGDGTPFSAEIEASDDGETWARLGRVRVGYRDGVGTLNFANHAARYFRIVPDAAVTITEAVFHTTPRIDGWVAKARPGSAPVGVPGPATDLKAQYAIDPGQVIDISAQLDPAGNLVWTAPEGRWTILRLGHAPASVTEGKSGLGVDMMSAKAVDRHFDAVAATLVTAAGALAGKTLETLAISAPPAGTQNWTTDLPDAFRKRNGYAILPYLPALTGRIVGDLEASDRFLFDFRRTLADLRAQNYYGRIEERARGAGLKLRIDGGDWDPADALAIAGRAAIPMTRFAAQGSEAVERGVRIATSAAQAYGRSIIAAEAFVGDARISRWQDQPYALKALGDRMFAAGINQFVLHGVAHQPNANAVPGMTMGPGGVHLGKSNTWVPQSKGWIDYIARSQYLLRQGVRVADILYLADEEGPPPGRPQARGSRQPQIPTGHAYDLINAEALLTRASVKDGFVTLPSGARYRLLVLPADLAGMTPRLVAKIGELVEAGVAIVGPKPRHPLSLAGKAEGDTAFRTATDAIWGDGKTNRRYGAGHVFPSATIAEVLDALKIIPDADCRTASTGGQLAWLHRKLPSGDMYFVANAERHAERVTCTFRVGSAAPSLWDAESGTVTRSASFRTTRDTTQVTFELPPAGSTFVMLDFAAGAKRADWIAKDGKRFVDLTAKPAVAAKPPIDSFTISLWAKPEADLGALPDEAINGRLEDRTGYLIGAGADPVQLVSRTAIAGLALGRNGAFVIERGPADEAAAVLVSKSPVSGWTHIALVYDKGRPSLYLNGKLARTGLRSGRTVHAGTDAPANPIQVFAGLSTPAIIEPRARPPEEIAAEAAAGLPAPVLTATAAELTREDDGRLHALVWESGDYTVAGGGKFRAEVPAPIAVEGPWSVSFQPGRRAPDRIELPALATLSRHADANVRHFSGTATYSRTIEVPSGALKKGRRVFLDLGRVEVLAGVTVNGRDLGVIWKEPYRVDITDVVRSGPNTVTVAVANLWVNRMIGDAALPEEGKFVEDAPRTDSTVRRITAFPDWYRAGKAKPAGGRVTFAPWEFHRADEPLVDSGLLGPVRLVFANTVTIK